MLIEFRVQNFRSFRDQHRLSMVASTDKELRESHTLETPAFKQRLLRSAVVYGPNASGKSNIIVALGFLQLFMLNAVNSPPVQGQRAIDLPILRPFLLHAEQRQQPSSFELSFIQNNVRYQYGLILDRETIHDEWLIAFPKGQPQTWFERRLRTADDIAQEEEQMNQQGTQVTMPMLLPNFMGSDNPARFRWYFGPRLGGEKQRLAALTRADVPFLAAAATFGNPQLRQVYDWFTTHLNVLNPWGHPDLFGDMARTAAENPHIREQLLKLLVHADFEIDDFGVRVITLNNDHMLSALPSELQSFLSKVNIERTEVTMRHRAPDTPEGYVELAGEEESLGTKRFFAIAVPIIQALQDGDVLAIDEIDDSLHPLLVRRLVELFHNPETNPHGAQLIMNTHDVTMLDMQLFRRDQIWFTEKDAVGASHLYPLSDYRPRKDEALSKGYLHGRYGAVPTLFDLGESLRMPDRQHTVTDEKV